MKKSLISAVKKLLAKLGAEEIEGNNLVEVIDSGADALEDGGGSGGGVFYVNLSAPNNIPYSDKTIEGIMEAEMAGNLIVFQTPASAILAKDTGSKLRPKFTGVAVINIGNGWQIDQWEVSDVGASRTLVNISTTT